MNQHGPETPFDSIEGSQEYVRLLSESIAEALADVEADIAVASDADTERKQQALQLVHFKLTRLQAHMISSGRLLNDLRSLRRLLLEERTLDRVLIQRAKA